MSVCFVGVHTLKSDKEKTQYLNAHTALLDNTQYLTDAQKEKIDWIAYKIVKRGHL